MATKKPKKRGDPPGFLDFFRGTIGMCGYSLLTVDSFLGSRVRFQGMLVAQIRPNKRVEPGIYYSMIERKING